VCGEFTQLSSSPSRLVMRKSNELVVSAPMRPAFVVMHLDGDGQRVMTAMRWASQA
jgi:hypothetical protein